MKRCMVVDDSSVIRKVATRILSGSGVQTVEAATGSQALSMCLAQMPDFIIVDNGLSDMTVVDFIRSAMAIDDRAKPDIVVCMARMDLGAIMRAKRAGARGYLLKPFDRQQLIERIRELDVAA